jgi:hypothetical protein
MTTKRTKIFRPLAARITPEIVALFELCEARIKDGTAEQWEEDGGHRAAYLDDAVRLQALLQRAPDEWEVLDARWRDPPAWIRDLPRLADYRAAWRLRRAILKAARELRGGRPARAVKKRAGVAPGAPTPASGGDAG